MAIQRAIYETKSAALHTDFAREFVVRRFGQLAADAIYAALPRFTRGVHKGQVKGFVSWLKVTEGGWAYRDMAGGVLKPGAHEVQIVRGFMEHGTSGGYLCESFKSENQTDQEYAMRCGLAVAEVFGTKTRTQILQDMSTSNV